MSDFIKHFIKHRLRIVSLLLAVTAGTALTSCDAFLTGTWRYKMTVSVETPEGLKTGSAVREIYASRDIVTFPESTGGHAKVDAGEAIVIDLGKRGVLFALMADDYGSDYAYKIVFDSFPFQGGALTPEGIRHYRALKAGKVTLTQEHYPAMVTFSDMRDPKSVEPVWQGEHYDERVGHGARRSFRMKTDNFEKIFGSGVKLKEVTIEMTDEPVTWGIEKWLPWLGRLKGRYLDGQFAGGGPALSNILYGGEFQIRERGYFTNHQ